MCLLQKQNPPTWIMCTTPPLHLPPSIPPPFTPPPPYHPPLPSSARCAQQPARSAQWASPLTTLKLQDSCGGHTPPCVCTALCVHRLVYALPCVWTAKPFLRLAALDRRLALLDVGASPHTPLKLQDSYGGHKPLVCAPPCVWTAKPSPPPTPAYSIQRNVCM